MKNKLILLACSVPLILSACQQQTNATNNKKASEPVVMAASSLTTSKETKPITEKEFKYTNPVIKLKVIDTNKKITDMTSAASAASGVKANVSEINCNDVANKLNLHLSKQVFNIEKAAMKIGLKEIQVFISDSDDEFKKAGYDFSNNSLNKVTGVNIDNLYHKKDDMGLNHFVLKYAPTENEKACAA